MTIWPAVQTSIKCARPSCTADRTTKESTLRVVPVWACATEYHRLVYRTSAHPQRGRNRLGRLQWGDLQLPRAAPGTGSSWPPLLHQHGHGGDRSPVRGVWVQLRAKAAWDVRVCTLG